MKLVTGYFVLNETSYQHVKIVCGREPKQDKRESIETCITSVMCHNTRERERFRIMEKSNTKKSGNTPKLSRKGTKKSNRITKLFSKAFSSQKLSSEKDDKSHDNKVNALFSNYSTLYQINYINLSHYLSTVISFIPICADYSTK